jgi:hypothetical protein
MRAFIVVSWSALLLTACASGTGGTARTSGSTARHDPNVITAEEIASKQAQTLYDVVRALRPAWMMRSRPTTLMPQNEGQLIVYVDGTRFGNIESLRQFVPNAVQTVRYYSPSDAEARFGPGHLHGAIEVITSAH